VRNSNGYMAACAIAEPDDDAPGSAMRGRCADR
jgi:hypothetical protein